MKLLGFLTFLFYAVILFSIVTSISDGTVPIFEIAIVNFILITNIAFRRKAKKEIRK